uniref:Uncharacterized protein n=1 Tax=Chelydra serpentina TaxID=8475 RepID=A0A8C3SAF6_CHESE
MPHFPPPPQPPISGSSQPCGATSLPAAPPTASCVTAPGCWSSGAWWSTASTAATSTSFAGSGRDLRPRPPRTARPLAPAWATASRSWATSATCLGGWQTTVRTPRTTFPG